MHDHDEADGSNAEHWSTQPRAGETELPADEIARTPSAEGPAWPENVSKTGDDSVDAILERLHGLPDLPTADQTQAYTQIHDSLLSELNADGDSD